MWKWQSVGSDCESWGGFVDCLVLVSMGFGFEIFWCSGVRWVLFSMSFSAWLLRKCKKRNKKSNSNVSNFSSLRSVSLSLKPVGPSLSLKDWCFTLSFAQINVSLLVGLSLDGSLSFCLILPWWWWLVVVKVVVSWVRWSVVGWIC